jgi:8-amino-7-oxononanoate synthase
MALFDKCRAVAERAEFFKSRSQFFYLREFEPTASTYVTHNGRKLLMLGSNNYLGLANHPKVKAAAIRAVEEYGTGACSSRILTGTSSLHNRLEQKLAAFKGAEDAALFSTGFMTMMAAVSSLAGERDVVLTDEYNHASIVDGCRLTKARKFIYRHNDMASLEEGLSGAKDADGRLIVTDGVFSMRGAVANLPEIRRLADKYDARVMVDDAHGTGVLGSHGRGTPEHFDMEGKVEVVCGTFSKTFATTGGFVGSNRDVVAYLKLASRPFIFTASPAPPVVATVLAGLDVMSEEPQLLEHLHRNSVFLKQELTGLGFRLEPTVTPIIPILIGNEEKTFKMAGALEEEGVVVNPVVRPAVPAESSLIRVSLMASFSLDQLAEAVDKFGRVGKRLGLI